jgi:hypothetical protein
MEYSNSFVEGCSVTGGIVYRGCEFPEMYGHYIFADYCSGKFWQIWRDEAGEWQNEQIGDLDNFQFVGFGENVEGQLFVAQLGSGRISKVVPSGDLLVATDETCFGAGSGTVSFTIPTDQFVTASWSDGSDEINRDNLAPGTYEVTVTTANGCEFTGSAVVEPGPGLGIPVEIMVTNDSILSIPDVGAVSYQWLLDNEPIEGATDLTYTAQESGNYSVSINFGPDCVFFPDEVSVMVLQSAEDALGLNRFLLSPNPFGDELTLQVSASQNLEVDMSVTDLNGQIFLRQQALVNGGFAQTFDLSDLPSGVYFFRVKTEKGEWSEKVVKK